MSRDFDFKVEVQLALLRTTPTHERFGSDLAFDLIEPRFVENDLTIEKVASVLATAAPKGLLMVRDELAGWLSGMNRFNAGARAFWLEAYGGRPYRVDRVKSPQRISVPRLAVAWHGGIQPGRLAKLMTDADDGLLARFIWFWPDPIDFKRPTATPNLDFALSAFERLSLLELAPRTSDQWSAPILIPLSEEAASHLEAFAREARAMQAGSTGLITSTLGKARGLVLRLSLVFAYLRWSAEEGMTEAPNSIGEEPLLAAINLVKDYLLPMAQRVYGAPSSSSHHERVQVLANWILRTRAREVHVRNLQRHERLPDLRTAPAIHDACNALVRAGWLERPPRGSNKGRARQAYKVQTRIWPIVKRQK